MLRPLIQRVTNTGLKTTRLLKREAKSLFKRVPIQAKILTPKLPLTSRENTPGTKMNSTCPVRRSGITRPKTHLVTKFNQDLPKLVLIHLRILIPKSPHTFRESTPGTKMSSICPARRSGITRPRTQPDIKFNQDLLKLELIHLRTLIPKSLLMFKEITLGTKMSSICPVKRSGITRPRTQLVTKFNQDSLKSVLIHQRILTPKLPHTSRESTPGMKMSSICPARRSGTLRPRVQPDIRCFQASPRKIVLPTHPRILTLQLNLTSKESTPGTMISSISPVKRSGIMRPRTHLDIKSNQDSHKSLHLSFKKKTPLEPKPTHLRILTPQLNHTSRESTPGTMTSMTNPMPRPGTMRLRTHPDTKSNQDLLKSIKTHNPSLMPREWRTTESKPTPRLSHTLSETILGTSMSTIRLTSPDISKTPPMATRNTWNISSHIQLMSHIWFHQNVMLRTNRRTLKSSPLQLKKLSLQVKLIQSKLTSKSKVKSILAATPWLSQLPHHHHQLRMMRIALEELTSRPVSNAFQVPRP